MTTEPQAAVQPAPPAVAGMALAVIAGLSIFCALFFLSPAEMSSTQQNDDSPLASVINLMVVYFLRGSCGSITNSCPRTVYRWVLAFK